MNELAIRPMRVDPRNYFLSLVGEGRRLGIIPDEQAQRIGMETMVLLRELTLRYTHGASSSVRVETAQRLMASALFCVGHGLKRLDDAQAASEKVCAASVRSLYEKGRGCVEETAQHTRALLAEVRNKRVVTCNLAYNDTIGSGLEAFFDAYDAEFGAHENPGSIDYPVRVPARDGIEYMEAYLSRVDIQNRFCHAAGYTDRLLHGYYRGGKDLLINLFDLMLSCCVGAVLCGKQPDEYLTAQDAAYLGRRLKDLPDNRLKAMLRLACTQSCAKLRVDEETATHAAAAMDALLPDIRTALRTGHPETVFVVPKGKAEYHKA